MAEKIPCSFCRNEYSPFNVKKHEEKCAMNPANGAPGAINSAPELRVPVTEAKKPTMKISNVIVLPKSGLVANFKQEGSNDIVAIPLNYLGTITIGDEENVSLLVVGADGLLQPPLVIEGFVGISKEDNEPAEPEPEAEPEVEMLKEPRVLLTEENSAAEILGQIKEAKNEL